MTSPSVTGEKPSFVMMVKPVGSLCNMRCDYCYYLDTAYEDGRSSFLMTDDMLELFIRKYIEASVGPVVSFTWHGGEPAACGIDFYEKVVKLQEKYLPEGFHAVNNLQTNGTLLDDAFCRFLAEHHFDVGLSIDGTRTVHDKVRHMADGSPSYDRSCAAIKRLLSYGIRPDLLCTVHKGTLPYAKAVYQALRDFGTGWIQFIPIVNQEEGGISADSITPEEYGEFLKDVFSAWFYHDLGKVNVQLFAETAKVLSGGSASVCTLAPTCGTVLVAEHDGSIYSCDHFVDQDHRLGNIAQDDLISLLQSPDQQAFGRSKEESLTAECRRCPYLSLCRGGCLKDRFALSSDGQSGHYYLCAGLKSFYDYAVPRLKEAMNLSSQHVPASRITDLLIQNERMRYAHVGRNDLCPCGSGRKFKSCCQRRVP